MKRTLLIAGLLLAFCGGLWAQTYDFSIFEKSFTDFANGVANSLPATASIGTWSPAYIGQFPHFGVGLTAGGAFLPYSTIEGTLKLLGKTLPSQVAFMEKYGLPFPAAAVDARLGGFFIPFDLGLKFGMIPEKAKELFGSVNVDYLMIGGDLRFPILKDAGFVPAFSLGVGYTYLKGRVGMPNVMADTIVDITTEMNAAEYTGAHTLTIPGPALDFGWRTHTMYAKAQLSKNLFIFTPHLGLGGAFGISEAGGGVSTSGAIAYDGSATKEAVDAAIASLGLTDTSLLVSADANGYSFWVYGGTAINIFFLRLDLSAMYDIVGRSYGASANLRVQF